MPSDNVLRYAGIGSRETPPVILDHMRLMAKWLGSKGWTLRSGGARGADSAFHDGSLGFPSEIFRPADTSPDDAAHALAALHHPGWPKLNAYVRALHARNGLIVLGRDLATPVQFVVCWTPAGLSGGGTGQALRVARSRSIPIFDLALCTPRSVCEYASSIYGLPL